jgi:hypothetical protein
VSDRSLYTNGPIQFIWNFETRANVCDAKLFYWMMRYDFKRKTKKQRQKNQKAELNERLIAEAELTGERKFKCQELGSYILGISSARNGPEARQDVSAIHCLRANLGRSAILWHGARYALAPSYLAFRQHIPSFESPFVL